jgi:hypothetical protein
MENLWLNPASWTNERTVRVMIPMTKDDLYNKVSTADNYPLLGSQYPAEHGKNARYHISGSGGCAHRRYDRGRGQLLHHLRLRHAGATILYQPQHTSAPATRHLRIYGRHGNDTKKLVFGRHRDHDLPRRQGRLHRRGRHHPQAHRLRTGCGLAKPLQDVSSDSWYYDYVA